MQPYVKLNIKEGVGIIEFFHPNHNAMPSANLKKLEETILEAGHNPEVKVIVLQSGGDRTFCAGASFKELIAIEDEVSGKYFFSGFAAVINAMRTCSKIIIGRVQGKAVGGGVGLAAATDYCLATKHAAIKLSELSIGIGPFVIEPAVTRKIGVSAFSQMTLDAGTFFTAEYAKNQGLYADIFDTSALLDEAVMDLARKLSEYNPQALAELKAVLWKGTEHWVDLLNERAAISGRLVLSDFTKSVLSKFKEA